MRFFTQGGGEVKPHGTDSWVFVNNPPHPFQVGDLMPDEWGIVSESPEIEDYLEWMFGWDSDTDL